MHMLSWFFRYHNVINFGQASKTPPLKSSQIELKYAKCSETFKKNNFPISTILIFVDMIGFILRIIRKLTKISSWLTKFSFCPKICAMFWNICKNKFPISHFSKKKKLYSFSFFIKKNISKKCSRKNTHIYMLFVLLVVNSMRAFICPIINGIKSYTTVRCI